MRIQLFAGFFLLACSAATFAQSPTVLVGDAAAGETKAATCAACHGMDGNSVDPQYPKIAGQHEQYSVKQLALFKSGARVNPIMAPFTLALSEQDMHDLGAFFASKKVLPGVADEALADLGKSLYQGGNKESGTPACKACHGPTGRGNPASGYPAIAGQHATYTETMLNQFRNPAEGTAINPHLAIMIGVSGPLSDQDIAALASYIEGLHAAKLESAP